MGNNNKQIRLTESMILEAVDEILTDYNETSSNLKDSAKDALQTQTGFEKWYLTNCLPKGIDKEQALNAYVEAKRDIESQDYMNWKYSYKPVETPDYNQNVLDYGNGVYSMMAQSEEGNTDSIIGKSKRPTYRQTRSEIEKSFMNEGRINAIIDDVLNKFLAKS